MKRCVILSACPVSEKMAGYLRADDHVIACDAGYRNAQRLGIRPDRIVGDFDSAPQPCADKTDLTVLPHVKDDTDTQYAARLALQDGYKEVLILGGLGGRRLEHSIANFSTGLFLTKNGARTVLADEYSELHFLAPDRPLCLPRQDWMYFSVFPLEGVLEGVSIRGAFYPLENARLQMDYPLGVSNEFVADTVQIACRQGYGLVVLTRAD